MLKVQKADESDFYNVVGAQYHDLIFVDQCNSNEILKLMNLINVIDWRVLKTRDCWNIVVRQGPIPWFDL